MISIAMATYNGEKYLREQLDSILSQTMQEFELIVCDDCSLDSTVQILREYEKADERIKVFENDHNLGFKKNFERAIGLCSGEYIALCDQDDIWLPEHLNVLLDNIGENDLCGANSLLIDENNNELGKNFLEKIKRDRNIPKNNEEFFFLLIHQNVFQGANCIFRSSLINKILPIPENVKFHDQWIGWVACENRGVYLTDKIVSRYRQHKDNVIGMGQIKQCESYGLIFEQALQELLKISPLEKRKYIEESICYYRDIQNESLKQIPYFLKNYYKIFRSNNIFLFLARLCKRLLLPLKKIRCIIGDETC